MNKKYKLFLYITLLLMPVMNGMAQEEPISQEKLTQWLNQYLSVNQGDSMEGSPIGFSGLQNMGIDPVQFSLGLIADIQYSEYWFNARNFYAPARHQDKKDVEMVKKISEWLEREEKIYTSHVIMFKTFCLSFLLRMVGPNHFQDEALKNTILAFAGQYFQEGKRTDPHFWYQRFSLEKLASQSRQSLSQEEQDSLMWAETLGRESVKFAGYLFYATSDKTYEKIVQECVDSEFPQIKNQAKWALSEKPRIEWQKGRYELFAPPEHYKPTPEEIERMKQIQGGGLRTIKKQNQPQQ